MEQELQQLVERVWTEKAKDVAASQAVASMSAQARLSLTKLLSSLHTRVSARRVLDEPSSSSSFSNEEQLRDLSNNELVNVLLLITLAVYHSDSLCFEPPELRTARLDEWARLTGLSIDVVKEAAILGPDGLRRLG